MPAERIACLILPLFPLAARLRSEPELAREALVVVEGNGNAARVVAANRLARGAGIKPAQTLTQARALCPKLIARPVDDECGGGLAYLDIQGIERHFGKDGSPPELDLGRSLANAADATALPARVGIASSKLAARIAAGLPETPVIVPDGEEAAFLAPLPLARLAPDADLAATLERWGVRTVGDFAKLPQARIASRLGQRG